MQVNDQGAQLRPERRPRFQAGRHRRLEPALTARADAGVPMDARDVWLQRRQLNLFISVNVLFISVNVGLSVHRQFGLTMRPGLGHRLDDPIRCLT